MHVKLKVLHGMLKSKDGSAAPDVAIKSRRFVIGAGADCQMRCPSGSISERHCEILVEDDGVLLRDLGSEAGTFLNDERIEDEQILKSGDRLRVGRLEFELDIDLPAGLRPAKQDAVDDFVSDLLEEADAEERETRKADPRLREFHLEKSEDQPEDEEEEVDRETLLRRKLPPRNKPRKLPKPPSITGESSVDAAEETLKKFFEKPKPKKGGS